MPAPPKIRRFVMGPRDRLPAMRWVVPAPISAARKGRTVEGCAKGGPLIHSRSLGTVYPGDRETDPRPGFRGGIDRARVTFSRTTMRHTNFSTARRDVARLAKARFGAAIRNPHETGNIFHGLSRHDVSGSGSARRNDSPTERVEIFHGAAGQVSLRPGMTWKGKTSLARNAGQFSAEWRGFARPATAWQSNNVTGYGNPGHFPKHQ